MKDTYLQYLVKFDKVPQDDIAMRLQHGKRNEEDHSVCVIIRPQNLPQTENILEWELALERDKDPTVPDWVNNAENSTSKRNTPETEEQVQPVRFLKVPI
jgi:hypothetical protein